MQHATHATAYICNMRHMQQHKYATRYTHRIHMQYATRNSMYMRHTQQHTAARWRSRRHTAQNATTPWHRRATANPPPDLTVPRGITAPHGMPCPVKFPGGKSYTPSRPQMLCLPVRTSCGCHCVPYGVPRTRPRPPARVDMRFAPQKHRSGARHDSANGSANVARRMSQVVSLHVETLLRRKRTRAAGAIHSGNVTRVAATAPTIHVTVRIENTCGPDRAAPLSSRARARTRTRVLTHV